MAEYNDGAELEHESTRDKMNSYLYVKHPLPVEETAHPCFPSFSPKPEQDSGRKHYHKIYIDLILLSSSKYGLNKGVDGLIKGKAALEHSLGLGPKPNVIPPGEAVINGQELRLVEIGWHPVGGLGGKWFAEKTGLGKKITQEIHQYPDPTQHWAVLVGDYCHELWMDEHFDVIYINEKIDRSEWHTFDVGQTRFNDEALRQTGEMVIHNMREKRPAYNLISNNCQNFAVSLLDAIQIGAHREFATSFAVYQRATGRGKIEDLFVDKHPDEQTDQSRPELHRQDTVQNAQMVMEQNTTKLDNHHHNLFSH